jgi:hypothetical protein
VVHALAFGEPLRIEVVADGAQIIEELWRGPKRRLDRRSLQSFERSDQSADVGARLVVSKIVVNQQREAVDALGHRLCDLLCVH